MSPVSRGRNRKKQGSSTRPRQGRGVGAEQGLDGAHEETPRSADRGEGFGGEGFGDVGSDAADPSSARLLLRDLDPGASPEEVQEVLDRRRFAMPLSGTRIGDEDYPHLNPADPDERRLLIEGEHPEYYDVVTDPSFDGEVDGVNPQLHVAMHEVIANPLWDDDPPEAWRAAVRLRGAGMDRHDILHQLVNVMVSHLHDALARQDADVAPYRRALDALTPPPGAGRQPRHAR